MSVLVKICGLTNVDDALDAVELGADFLGFNFYQKSPRFIEPLQAKEILEEIPGSIKKVGIFVNEEYQQVIDVAVDLELDFVQFHGNETPEFCNQFGRPWFKAFRLKEESDVEKIKAFNSEWALVDSYVEKTFGGTGVLSNWDLAKKAGSQKALFLSGGLKPDNVLEAVKFVKPYAVDVASGVESSPGAKDYYKMEEFIKKAKSISF